MVLGTASHGSRHKHFFFGLAGNTPHSTKRAVQGNSSLGSTHEVGT